MRVHDVSDRLTEILDHARRELGHSNYGRAVLARIKTASDDALYMLDDDGVAHDDPFTALDPTAQSEVSRQAECISEEVSRARANEVVSEDLAQRARGLADSLDRIAP